MSGLQNCSSTKRLQKSLPTARKNSYCRNWCKQLTF